MGLFGWLFGRGDGNRRLDESVGPGRKAGGRRRRAGAVDQVVAGASGSIGESS